MQNMAWAFLSFFDFTHEDYPIVELQSVYMRSPYFLPASLP